MRTLRTPSLRRHKPSSLGVVTLEVNWTANLLNQALRHLADLCGMPVGELADRTLAGLVRDCHEQAVEAEAQAAEVAALARRRLLAGARAVALLGIPDEQVEGRVTRYESHLSRQLYAALHELERLQERRLGRPVAPPVAIDATLTVGGAGR